MYKNLFFLSAVLLAHVCYADYIGAVVESNPVSQTSPTLTIEKNVDTYVRYIQALKSQGGKIIVFPEYGLTGLVENPQDYAVEVPDVGASNFSTDGFQVLTTISDAALENSLYVVINLIEKANRTDNTTIYYNTNLVFADNGTLVAKYRKINLFQEPHLTPGTESVTFTTSFGVTFGLMTCMDILYYNPSQTMLKDKSVTDVIYPAAWNSFLPFYMSLEVQVGYALANKVNLLAANLNDPSNGKGGSGIYKSDGTALSTILTDKPANSLAHANIPPPSTLNRQFTLLGFDFLRNDTVQELANYKSLYDFQHKSYVFQSVDLSGENITQEVCHGKFCCSFNIHALKNETNTSEIYKLVAFNGNAQFDKKRVNMKQCNLIACQNEDKSSCGVRPTTPYTTKFRQIIVWGSFKNESDLFFRPTSLRGNLVPVYNVTYHENKTNVSYEVSFRSTLPVDNVVLFGLYGRSGVDALNMSVMLMTVIFLIQKMF